MRLRFSKTARQVLIEAAKQAAIEKIQSHAAVKKEAPKSPFALKEGEAQDSLSRVQRELFEMVSPARVQFDKAMHETIEKIKIGADFEGLSSRLEAFEDAENQAVTFLLECISHHPQGTLVSMLTRGDIKFDDALWYMRRTEEQPLPVSAIGSALRFIEDSQRLLIESLPEASLRGLDINDEDIGLVDSGLQLTLEIEAVLGKAASNKQGLLNIMMHKIVEQQKMFLKSAVRLELDGPSA
jgi:hypothetical protein